MFSFGVLLAFTATQLAVIKLRIDEPDLPRPYRTPLNVTIRKAEIPLPAIVGAVLTFAVWILALVDARRARATPAPSGSRSASSSTSPSAARTARV